MSLFWSTFLTRPVRTLIHFCKASCTFWIAQRLEGSAVTANLIRVSNKKGRNSALLAAESPKLQAIVFPKNRYKGSPLVHHRLPPYTSGNLTSFSLQKRHVVPARSDHAGNDWLGCRSRKKTNLPKPSKTIQHYGFLSVLVGAANGFGPSHSPIIQKKSPGPRLSALHPALSPAEWPAHSQTHTARPRSAGLGCSRTPPPARSEAADANGWQWANWMGMDRRTGRITGGTLILFFEIKMVAACPNWPKHC